MAGTPQSQPTSISWPKAYWPKTIEEFQEGPIAHLKNNLDELSDINVKNLQKIKDLNTENQRLKIVIRDLNTKEGEWKMEKEEFLKKQEELKLEIKCANGYADVVQGGYHELLEQNKSLKEELRKYRGASPPPPHPDYTFNTCDSFESPPILTSSAPFLEQCYTESSGPLVPTECHVALKPASEVSKFEVIKKIMEGTFAKEMEELKCFNLKKYLFNPDGEEKVPQVVFSAKNPCTFYQHQMPVKSNPNWKALSDEEKAFWKLPWEKMRKIQKSQIKMGYIELRKVPEDQEKPKAKKRKLSDEETAPTTKTVYYADGTKRTLLM